MWETDTCKEFHKTDSGEEEIAKLNTKATQVIRVPAAAATITTTFINYKTVDEDKP